MSEAVEAITRMLNAYPNAKALVSDGYYGAIAAILCKYPRSIALRCADPSVGVATATSYIPTAAEVVKWLEREQLPLRNAADRARRTTDQMHERERQEREDKAEPLEHRRKVAQRITRELHKAFERGNGLVPNVFVPTFAPQYRAMCERAQHEPPERAQYGHSLEDKTRMGIWVPLEWLKPTRARRPETPEEAKQRILSQYGKAQADWDALPDAPQSSDHWQGVRWPSSPK